MAGTRALAVVLAAWSFQISGCSGRATPARSSSHSDGHSDAAAACGCAVASLKRATEFMVERVSTRGGYVWSYLPDFSRRWGEMEAYDTMIWVQPPGTPTVGQLFLDAYHATYDEYYYRAALQAGEALVAGQLPSGGWNYMIDFAGEASLRRWYDTIGKNGWRLEEFQHYWGNATFDDGGTAESTRFLLRLYVERHDERFRESVDKALDFVLQSQLENGCWPQRYPMTEDHVRSGQPTYPRDATFNDDVAAKNIDVLLMYYLAFGDARLLERVRRAMDCYLLFQLPPPQPGWSLQYGPDGTPGAARTYEPAALSTKITAENVAELLNFYALTGEKKYLERVPAALAWLESVRMPKTPGDPRPGYPALVLVGSNEPIFVHRRGSNVTNGAYYFDHDPSRTIVHSKQIRALDVEGLRARYLWLEGRPHTDVTRDSPLLPPFARPGFPRFFSGRDLPMSDRTRGAPAAKVAPALALRLCKELDPAGYWPAKLERISNPYRGPGPRDVAPGDFSETEVGDEYDTSPFRSERAPLGISTRVYVESASLLVRTIAGCDAPLVKLAGGG